MIIRLLLIPVLLHNSVLLFFNIDRGTPAASQYLGSEALSTKKARFSGGGSSATTGQHTLQTPRSKLGTPFTGQSGTGRGGSTIRPSATQPANYTIIALVEGRGYFTSCLHRDHVYEYIFTVKFNFRSVGILVDLWVAL